MWRTLVSFGLGMILSGTAQFVQAADPMPQKQVSDFEVGEPMRHGNLTIFPVSSQAPRDADRFITLDEGLKSGKIQILEIGAQSESNVNGDENLSAEDDPFAADPLSAEPAPTAEPADSESVVEEEDPFGEPASDSQDQAEPATSTEGIVPQQMPVDQTAGNNVNRLIVVNNADKPLYLMAGEIIVGGDQDRAIGQDFVVAAAQEPVAIEVFCVEHGRWGAADVQNLSLVISQTQSVHDRRDSVTLASDSDAQELARQARSGKFIGSVGNVNKSARIAVQEGKGQSAVWDEVGKENTKSGVTAESGTFTGQYTEEEAVRRLDPYLNKLQSPVADVKHVVGVIVAVNDKVDSADILESTPLFKKLWPKLLKSYALDAANAAGDAQVAQDEAAKPAKPCTREDAIAFLAELHKADAEAQKTAGGVAITTHVSPRLSTSTAFDQRLAPQGSAGMGGGFGGGIHSSGFSK